MRRPVRTLVGCRQARTTATAMNREMANGAAVLRMPLIAELSSWLRRPIVTNTTMQRASSDAAMVGRRSSEVIGPQCGGAWRRAARGGRGFRSGSGTGVRGEFADVAAGEHQRPRGQGGLGGLR